MIRQPCLVPSAILLPSRHPSPSRLPLWLPRHPLGPIVIPAASQETPVRCPLVHRYSSPYPTTRTRPIVCLSPDQTDQRSTQPVQPTPADPLRRDNDDRPLGPPRAPSKSAAPAEQSAGLTSPLTLCPHACTTTTVDDGPRRYISALHLPLAGSPSESHGIPKYPVMYPNLAGL